MRTLFIAGAAALFFAAVVTELSMRLWPGNYFALLVLSFVTLLLAGLLNLRLAGYLSPRPAARPERPSGNRQSDRQKGGDKTSADNRRGGRGNGRAATEPNRDGNSRRAERPSEPPPPSDAPRESGTVKWFNRNKGFGFVVRESGEEIFVHQRSIRATGSGDQRRRPTLRDGQAVTFVVAEREKGLQAEDVVPVEPS